MRNRKPIRRTADTLSADEVEMVVEEAVSAMDGERTGIEQGDPSNIDVDGDGDYYSVEVTAKVVDLHGSAGMANALQYSTIEWGGWIEIGYRDEDLSSLEVQASGPLVFDGDWQNAEARIGGEYDILRGEYNINTGEWTWYHDSM